MNHLGIINQEIHNHCKALEMIDNKFKSKIISVSKALSKSLKKVGQFIGVETEVAHLIACTYLQN